MQPQYLSATTRVARHFSLRDRRRALKGALLLPFSPRSPDAAKKSLSFCTSPSHRLHHGPCPVWSPLLHARRDRLDRVAVLGEDDVWPLPPVRRDLPPTLEPQDRGPDAPTPSAEGRDTIAQTKDLLWISMVFNDSSLIFQWFSIGFQWFSLVLE